MIVKTPTFSHTVSALLLLYRIPVIVELTSFVRSLRHVNSRRRKTSEVRGSKVTMQAHLEIGDLVRVSSSASRYRGRPGMITDIEKDPRGLADWDICTVYLWIVGTQHFRAEQLEKTGSSRIFLTNAA